MKDFFCYFTALCNFADLQSIKNFYKTTDETIAEPCLIAPIFGRFDDADDLF